MTAELARRVDIAPAPRAPTRLEIAVAAAGAVGLGVAAAIDPVAPLVLLVALTGATIFATAPFRMMLLFGLVLFSRPAELLPALEPLMLAKLSAIAALGLFVFGRAIARDFRLVWTPYHALMAALTVAVIASSATSSHRAESFALLNDVFLKIAILFVLVTNLCDRPSRLVALKIFMAAVTAGMALYSIHARVTGAIVVEGSRAAYVGALGDPNDFALVMFMYLPFLIECAIGVRGMRRAGLVLLALCLVAGMVATQSRGGFLGLALSLVVLFRDRGTRRARLVALPVLGVALLGIVALSGATERQSGAVGSDGIDESAQGRLDAWNAGGRMFARHPLLGVGFGAFRYNFDSYARDAVFWGEHETHNSYIKCAAETGILGTLPFLALIGLSVAHARRLSAETPRTGGPGWSPLYRAARRASLATWAGFALVAFFLSQTWSWYFYLLFAETAVLYALDRGERSGTPATGTIAGSAGISPSGEKASPLGA